MTFLFIVFVIVALSIILHEPAKPGNTDKFVVVKNKVCPPHQWLWKDIVDQNGVKQGERMVCKLCGPLQGQSGRD